MPPLVSCFCSLLDSVRSLECARRLAFTVVYIRPRTPAGETLTRYFEAVALVARKAGCGLVQGAPNKAKRWQLRRISNTHSDLRSNR